LHFYPQEIRKNSVIPKALKQDTLLAVPIARHVPLGAAPKAAVLNDAPPVLLVFAPKYLKSEPAYVLPAVNGVWLLTVFDRNA
jgi:hypothetical protein